MYVSAKRPIAKIIADTTKAKVMFIMAAYIDAKATMASIIESVLFVMLVFFTVFMLSRSVKCKLRVNVLVNVYLKLSA